MPYAGRNPRGRHGAPSINNQLQLVPSSGPRAYARRNACSLRHIEYVTDHAKYEFAKALATSQSDDIEFLRQVERETESKALVDEIYEFEQTILSKRDNPEATLACLAMEEMYSLVLRVKETSRERFNHMIGDIRGQVERTCKENDRLRIARARWNWLRIGQKLLLRARQIYRNAAHVAILKHQSTSLKRQVYALRSCVRHEDCRFDVLRDQLAHRKQQLRNQKKEARERDDLQQQVHSTERRLAQVEHFSAAVAEHAFPELRRQDRLIRDGQRMLSSMLDHFDDARASDYIAASGEVQRLERKITELNNDLADQRLSYDYLTYNNGDLNKSLSASVEQVGLLEGEVTALTDRLETLDRSSEDLTFHNTRLESAVATLTSETQEVTSQNAHLDRCNESAKRQVGELTERVKDLKRFNRELTRFNSTLNSEKLEVDDRNAELDRCNKELANRITGAERQVAELSENIEMLDKSNESLTHSSNEMYMSNNTLENITRARDDLADGTAKLEQQLNDSEGLVERLRDRTGTLEGRVSELEDRNDKDRADQRRGLMEKQRYVEGRHYLQQFADQKSWYIDKLQRVKRMKDAAAAYSKSPKLALKHLAMQFSADLRDADFTAQQDQQVIGELARLVEVLCRAFTAAADKVEAAMSQKTMRRKRPFGARRGKKAKSTTRSGC
ncbi:hypothetical protein KC354_g8475 [Hortaea werneckii]|nr:hypothetical protein KC354_g8475 [Hortaea werneckii]